MRLKLDENLGQRGADLLRAAGHDVATVADQKLCSSSDRELVAVCQREQRGLVTLDLDFANPLLFPPHRYAGMTEIDRPGELNLVNNGTLAEQFIGQHFHRLQPPHRAPELHYWAREARSSSAAVDFVISDDSRRVVPVEVKAGSTGSLRSLQIMVLEKSLPRAVKFCSSPPSVFKETRGTVKGPVEFELISLPHYLVQQLPRLLSVSRERPR
ncbi:MAG: DUF5615 family PIN-like protein [Candidatus Riflebacteria bacterium]|nr:DUF5615 family PIN-like protein [Candidatus Riflebacteria bacterium]